jgi:hypothetical protein
MPPVAPPPIRDVLPGVVAPGVIRFGENVRREDGPPRAVSFATTPCAIAKLPESANAIASVIIVIFIASSCVIERQALGDV